MKVGRPPTYKTPEDMQEDIDIYFKSVTREIEGFEVVKPTVEGLAYALGLSRMSLINYAKKDEFLYTIKRAKQRIAIALETNLWGNAVTGTIFNLKNNFGWKDKTEIDSNQVVTVVNIRDTKAEKLNKP